MNECSLQVLKSNSYTYRYIAIPFHLNFIIFSSYPGSFFRQLHYFLQATVKSSFRIHNRGLLVAKFILKLGDIDAFLTAVVIMILFIMYYI